MASIHARLTATHHKASALLALRPLDVIVKTGSQVIPEKGHLGYSPEPGLIVFRRGKMQPAVMGSNN